MILRTLEQWHRLSLVRRGHRVHATTDPTCRWYRAPRRGSRLDRASRGVTCPACPKTQRPHVDHVFGGHEAPPPTPTPSLTSP